MPSEQETEILQLSLRVLDPEAAQLAQVVGLQNMDQALVGFPISEVHQQHTASLHPTTPVAFTPHRLQITTYSKDSPQGSQDEPSLGT